MGTSYIEIYDLALVSIQDYLIDKLARKSEEDLFTYLEGFLMKAIPKFHNCKQNLADRDDDNRQFNCTLTDMEKLILSDYLVLTYLDKEILDRRQIIGMLQNKTEANRYSEANLLKEKMNLRASKNEEVNYYQTLYDLKN